MAMKILLTLPRPLFPPDTGGKIRSLNILARLARRAEIHAVSFADPIRDAAAISKMRSTFESFTPVFWQEATKGSLRFYREVLTNQCSALPYFLAKFHQPRFRTTVEELAARRQFNLIFCDFLHTAAPLAESPLRPRLVFEHNVEFLLRKRKWELEKHPLRKLVLDSERRKTRTIEAQVCRSFDHIIAVSQQDQQTLSHEFGVKNVSTLPTGVDTDFFRPLDDQPQAGNLVFVGSMDWDPNEDGIMWFLREVYPRIHDAIPNASLSVVGRNPSSRLRSAAARHPGVRVTGWVPDVRPHLAQAEVVVVPLRVGGGTRIKIPEAMAMGKAVVSTPVGAEGLPFGDGREIRIAEQPEEFAQGVIELLRNVSLRNSIGRLALKEVASRYSWDVVVDRLEEILEQVTRPRTLAVVA
jgi:sugar transferase (PEP-CTERM/EpsH1 system associated)